MLDCTIKWPLIIIFCRQFLGQSHVARSWSTTGQDTRYKSRRRSMRNCYALRLRAEYHVGSLGTNRLTRKRSSHDALVLWWARYIVMCRWLSYTRLFEKVQCVILISIIKLYCSRHAYSPRWKCPRCDSKGKPFTAALQSCNLFHVQHFQSSGFSVYKWPVEDLGIAMRLIERIRCVLIDYCRTTSRVLAPSSG